MAKIIGFWASDAHNLDPDRWVNVYRDSGDRPIYHSSCQVKDLRIEAAEADWWFLEPCEENGTLILEEK